MNAKSSDETSPLLIRRRRRPSTAWRARRSSATWRWRPTSAAPKPCRCGDGVSWLHLVHAAVMLLIIYVLADPLASILACGMPPLHVVAASSCVIYGCCPCACGKSQHLAFIAQRAPCQLYCCVCRLHWTALRIARRASFAGERPKPRTRCPPGWARSEKPRLWALPSKRRAARQRQVGVRAVASGSIVHGGDETLSSRNCVILR